MAAHVDPHFTPVDYGNANGTCLLHCLILLHLAHHACFCIVVNSCVCFSIQMYPQSASGKNVLQKLNNVFTTLFAIECTLKVVAVGIRVSR